MLNPVGQTFRKILLLFVGEKCFVIMGFRIDLHRCQHVLDQLSVVMSFLGLEWCNRKLHRVFNCNALKFSGSHAYILKVEVLEVRTPQII